MDIEDTHLGDEMTVQITIHMGDKCGVELSTACKVSAEPAKARVRITDIVTTLLESVPLATLRGHERVFMQQPSVAVVLKDGSLIEVTAEIERAIIEQAKLRERMEKKDKHD